MNPPLLFLLLCLATFRAWRLVGRDDITAPLRAPLPEIVLKGIACYACLGTWMAASTVLTHLFVIDLFSGTIHNRAGLVALVTAAVAGGVVFLGEIDARLDDD